ncbi:hypothetical protein VaNZ11_007872 [Volvox africanus]|uniref:Glycosyl transferase CAP10 domain-containing protein n=1 Tax=Volvox africanus TaxID=51714 RepID=A0ABQ5S4X9_9CHLO|nr:hypothetical protein VaNZ11_007872 [Volvox africanus]
MADQLRHIQPPTSHTQILFYQHIPNAAVATTRHRQRPPQLHLPSPTPPPCLFLLCLFMLTFWNITATSSGPNATELRNHCQRFNAFEPGIAEDLLPWYDDAGISEGLMDRTLRERTMQARVPGLPLCIRGGRLFVINGSVQSIGNVLPWQAENIIVYAWALSRLVSRWGAALPDAEFVIETMDSPSQDLGPTSAPGAEWQRRGSGDDGGDGDEGDAVPPPRPLSPEDAEGGVWGEPHGRLPVMRHCKTASSPDVTVPTFHLYKLHFDQDFLEAIEQFNAEHPWEDRVNQAFAGGVSYHREQRIPSTTRQWDGIHRGEVVMNLRGAFSEYLRDELCHPNITYIPRPLRIQEWAKFKMVMNIDGISCSSRLFQMLSLGSVVLREQSGYFAFYDKLLRKFEHYVPFWSHRPREVVWAYNWVTANDAAARAIASRGQQFTRHFLSREAIECYWALLLHQYAKLLRFTPGERREGDGGSARRSGGGSGGSGGGDGQETGVQRPRQRQQHRRWLVKAEKEKKETEERREEGQLVSSGGDDGSEGDEEEVREIGPRVRQLELVPIGQWLEAQDGIVKDWEPDHVMTRVQSLNLLPEHLRDASLRNDESNRWQTYTR